MVGIVGGPRHMREDHHRADDQRDAAQDAPHAFLMSACNQRSLGPPCTLALCLAAGCDEASGIQERQDCVVNSRTRMALAIVAQIGPGCRIVRPIALYAIGRGIVGPSWPRSRTGGRNRSRWRASVARRWTGIAR